MGEQENVPYKELRRDNGCGKIRLATISARNEDIYNLLFVSTFRTDILNNHQWEFTAKETVREKMIAMATPNMNEDPIPSAPEPETNINGESENNNVQTAEVNETIEVLKIKKETYEEMKDPAVFEPLN